MRSMVTPVMRAALVLALVLGVVLAPAMQVNLISDIHLDPVYGADKAYGSCTSASAAEFGQSGCDAPSDLLISLAADARLQKSSYTLMAGSFQRHDMQQSGLQVQSVFGETCSLLSTIKGDTLVADSDFSACLGSTDFVPENTFDYTAKPQTTLNAEVNLLKEHQMFSDPPANTMADCGFYSRDVTDKLHLIVLNTLVWSNAITPAVPETEADPCGQLAFLAAELKSAAKQGKKALILGHLPPTADVRHIASKGAYTSAAEDMFWKAQYQTQYTNIIAKYRDTITAQVFGHTHAFSVVADDKLKVPLFVLNAVSPVDGTLPAYMLATFNDDTWALDKLQQRYLKEFTKGEWINGQDVASALKLSSLSDMAALQSGLQKLQTDATLWANYQALRTGGVATETCDTPFCRALEVCAMLHTTYDDVKACTGSPKPSGVTRQPIYHIRPPSNWINDPNGPYRDPVTGTIHLYMQYNPFGPLWGNMSWYHVTSKDYVKWQRTKPEMAMTNDRWYDDWGVYSGTMMNDANGNPVAIYTCTEPENIQRQCLATPPQSDVQGKRAFDTLVKSPLNPILTEDDVPGLVELVNFRDPTEWWPDPADPSRWLIAFSTRIKDDDGDNAHVVVFSTSDPTFQSGYSFSHTLYMYKYDLDHMFECPDFFTLTDNKAAKPEEAHFLKLSTMPSHRDYIVYGSYEKDDQGKYVFKEDAERTFTFVDYGPMYASKTFYDPILKRRMMWGWLNEDLTDDQILQQGWSGMMNLLREVGYDETEKKLTLSPVPEIQGLRKAKVFTQKGMAVSAAAPTTVLPAGSNATLYHEIIARFHIDSSLFDSQKFYTADKAPEFGVIIRGDANLAKKMTVSVRMPEATAAPLAGKAQDEQYPAFKVYDAAATDPEKDCSAQCAKERTCMTWTYSATPKPTCTHYWRPSTFVDNKDAQSGAVNEAQLVLERGESGSIGGTYSLLGRAPLTQTHPNEVELRIFVDDSVVEVFKDGGLETLSGRVYLPGAEQQNGIALYAKNIDGVTADVTVYTLDNMWSPEPVPSAVYNFTHSLQQLLSKTFE